MYMYSTANKDKVSRTRGQSEVRLKKRFIGYARWKTSDHHRANKVSSCAYDILKCHQDEHTPTTSSTLDSFDKHTTNTCCS